MDRRTAGIAKLRAYIFQNFPAGCGVHLASSAVGAGEYFSRVQRPCRETSASHKPSRHAQGQLLLCFKTVDA